MSAAASARLELFRLLGDEDRVRLLALCAAEELAVSELAQLTAESQPQITKKTQPLREAGLLSARRDGTRTLLRTEPTDDAIIKAALEEGRALCTEDGSLARVPTVLAQREEGARRLFAEAREAGAVVVDGAQLLPFLPLLAPLLPRRALAVDVGTGEGALLPLLSPLYERVVGLDRSAARLARAADRVAALGLPNVRLLEGDAGDRHVVEELADKGGADLVVLSRVLRYASRPQDTVHAAARLTRPGGHVAVIDAAPTDDESRREPGQVWLGFDARALDAFLLEAALEPTHVGRLPRVAGGPADLQLAVARKPLPR
ncbi:MAG: methyltransferase domain-containing protein [Deltaproteobacteria bacterium]|nr:methyltransferase domain-containing protein [Deltaproteobacteria bacterium]